MTTEETPFKIGKAQIVFKSQGKEQRIRIRESHDAAHSKHTNKDAQETVGIIATGALLHRALLVAKKMDKEGKNVTVMNLSTIKPLDEEAVIKLAHETRALVTVEEHQIHGGMGSAVAE
ncbi:MAG: transketolase C-terminal domain-containing protein, partial [Patescibacteria group bacterium]